MHPDWKNNKSGRIGYRWIESKFSRSKSIVLVNTLENTAIHYETVSDFYFLVFVFLALGINKSFTSFVKRHLNPTNLYNNIYKFNSADNFKMKYQGVVLNNNRIIEILFLSLYLSD